MLTQAQTAGQYFTNDQIKEMTRKVSAEVDLVHQQTQNRSEERFSRNAETDLVCRLLLEKKNKFEILLFDKDQCGKFGEDVHIVSCDSVVIGLYQCSMLHLYYGYI